VLFGRRFETHKKYSRSCNRGAATAGARQWRDSGAGTEIVGLSLRSRSLQQRMILRQLLGIPDRQLVSHARFSHLIFWQWLDDLVVNEQAIDVEKFLTGRIRRLELHGLAAFRVLHTGQ